MDSHRIPTSSFFARVLLAGAIAAVASRPSAAIAANPPGTVTTWGAVETSVPVPVALPSGVYATDVASAGHGSYALTSDGLYGWFGIGNADVPSTTPTKVVFPVPVTQVKDVAVGAAHTLALTNDGVYAWGSNQKGQLGNGTSTSAYSTTPARVVFPPSVTTVSAIAAGYFHNLAATNDGLYAWGFNWNGEVGDGTRLDRSLPVKVVFPTTVTTVTGIAAGQNTSYAITNDLAYAWGNDYAGQLGNGSFGVLPGGSSDLGQPLPVKVLFNAKKPKKGALVTSVTQIVAGQSYALAITNDGVWAWGENVGGNLGTGTVGNTAVPLKVGFPSAVTSVKSLAAGVGTSLAVTNDGLYSWGYNGAGQLGNGMPISGGSSQPTPRRVPAEGDAIGAAMSEYVGLAVH